MSSLPLLSPARTSPSSEATQPATRHRRSGSMSMSIASKSTSTSPSPALEENDFLSRVLQDAAYDMSSHSRTSSMGSPTHELPNSPTRELTSKLALQVISTSTSTSPENLPPVSPATWAELTKIREEARKKEEIEKEKQLEEAERAKSKKEGRGKELGTETDIDNLVLFKPIPVSDDEE